MKEKLACGVTFENFGDQWGAGDERRKQMETDGSQGPFHYYFSILIPIRWKFILLSSKLW